jgi:hypothetical protein
MKVTYAATYNALDVHKLSGSGYFMGKVYRIKILIWSVYLFSASPQISEVFLLLL